MARYIDAEKLKGLLLLDQSGIKDALKHGTHLHPVRKLEHKAYIDAIEYCVQQINEAPTADVAEVRHGKWVHTDYAMHWLGKDECSECTYHTSDRDDLSHLKYCPNCGARMDGDEDD